MAEPSRSPLSLEQRFILAVGGILRQKNHDHFDLLAGRARGSGAGGPVLSYWWHIEDRGQLVSCLERLLADPEPGPEEEPEAEQDEGESEHLPCTPAYDLMRASNVAQWGYDSRLLTAEEAWGYLRRAAEGLRLTYGSFAGAARHYGMGYARNAEGEDEGEWPEDDEYAAVRQLIAPGGAWARLSGPEVGWPERSLLEVPLPIEEPRVVPAEPGEPIARCLERARVAVADPSHQLVRVTLAPGTYELSEAKIVGGVELIAAERGVVLAVPAGQSGFILDSTNSGLSLEGVELRGAEDSELIHVEAGFVHVRGATLRGGTRAVCATSGNAFVRLEDCLLSDVELGLDVHFGAGADVERTRFERVKQYGVRAGEAAALALVGCRMQSLAGIGLQLQGRARVIESRFDELRGSALEVLPGGRLHMAESDFVSCQVLGLMVHAGAGAVNVFGTRFRQAGTYAVQLQSTARFWGSSFEGSTQLDVLVWQCAASFADCVFRASSGSSVHVSNGGEPPSAERRVVLTESVVMGARGIGVLALDGGHVALVRSEVVDCVGSAVEARGGAIVSAGRSLLRGVGTRALHVHSEAQAFLHASRLVATVDQVVLVDEASARITGCEIMGSKSGVAVSASRLQLVATLIHHVSGVAGLVVANGSSAQLRSCVLRDNQETNAAVVAASKASFEEVRLEGSTVTVSEESAARLVRSVLTASPEAGLVIEDGGYAILASSEVSGAAYSGIEVREGARGLLIDSKVDQQAGEAAVYVRDGSELHVVKGELRGGKEAVVEVSSGSRVSLAEVSLVSKSGAPVHAGSPELLAHDGGAFVDMAPMALAGLETDLAWQDLLALAGDDLVPLPSIVELGAEDEEGGESEGDERDEEGGGGGPPSSLN